MTKKINLIKYINNICIISIAFLLFDLLISNHNILKDILLPDMTIYLDTFSPGNNVVSYNYKMNELLLGDNWNVYFEINNTRSKLAFLITNGSTVTVDFYAKERKIESTFLKFKNQIIESNRKHTTESNGSDYREYYIMSIKTLLMGNNEIEATLATINDTIYDHNPKIKIVPLFQEGFYGHYFSWALKFVILVIISILLLVSSILVRRSKNVK